MKSTWIAASGSESLAHPSYEECHLIKSDGESWELLGNGIVSLSSA